MTHFRISTDDLPPGLDEAARRRLWREHAEPLFCSADWTLGEDRPFRMTMDGARLGPLDIGRIDAVVTEVERRPHHIAADGNDAFHFGFSLGAPIAFRLPGRELEIAEGRAALLHSAEPGGWRSGPEQRWIALNVARRDLLALVPDAEDLMLRPLAPSPALAYLRALAQMTVEGAHTADTDVARVVRATVLDLMALALGARADLAQLARERGLRAARRHAVVREIERRFASPGCTPAAVARRLGMSPRYVQDLLQETGLSFTERVTELRLKRAAAMLRDPQHATRRIIDIAYDCGFADVTTFNRRFRARFGDSPSALRAGSIAGL